MDSVSLTSIAAFSYGFAAIGFVALAVPLLTGWRRRAYGRFGSIDTLADAFDHNGPQMQLGPPAQCKGAHNG